MLDSFVGQPSRRKKILPSPIVWGARSKFLLTYTELLADLDHVIKECSVHLFEPMGNAVGNDDDVTFFELMVFAADNFFRAHFARTARVLVDGLAASHECGGTLHNVENIGVVFVDLDFTGSRATAGHDFEIV